VVPIRGQLDPAAVESTTIAEIKVIETANEDPEWSIRRDESIRHRSSPSSLSRIAGLAIRWGAGEP
jgi:hypothetical protein